MSGLGFSIGLRVYMVFRVAGFLGLLIVWFGFAVLATLGCQAETSAYQPKKR